MRRFFVPEPISDNRNVNITGADSVHIAAVLRMKAGQRIILLDGSGWEYGAQIVSANRGRVVARIMDRQKSAAEPALHLSVAQALLKERKMDRLVRRLTELGVSRLVPYTSIRAVPRPSARRWQSRSQRWQRISREAMKQCGRGRVSEFARCHSWTDLISSLPEYDLTILFWEDARTPVSQIVTDHPPETVQKLLIILGPEGGFDQGEINTFRSQRIPLATLGPRILRADTAALAACTLAQYLWGDLGQKGQ